MTDKNSIVEDLYKLDIPRKVWRFQKCQDLFDDFQQHCFLQLLELPDEKFFSLVEQGTIANYFFILCKNQTGNTGSFWLEHRGKFNPYYDTYNDIEHLACGCAEGERPDNEDYD